MLGKSTHLQIIPQQSTQKHQTCGYRHTTKTFFINTARESTLALAIIYQIQVALQKLPFLLRYTIPCYVLEIINYTGTVKVCLPLLVGISVLYINNYSRYLYSSCYLYITILCIPLQQLLLVYYYTMYTTVAATCILLYYAYHSSCYLYTTILCIPLQQLLLVYQYTMHTTTVAATCILLYYAYHYSSCHLYITILCIPKRLRLCQAVARSLQVGLN